MSLATSLLALAAAFGFGLGLVLTQIGLQYLPPVRGGAVSVPTSALLFAALSPFTVDWSAWNTNAALIFVAIGLCYPAAVTFLTFESNRRLGAGMTGALGNTTPLFAVGFAVLLLGETPRLEQAAGIAVILAGVTVLFSAQVGLQTPRSVVSLLIGLGAAGVRGVVQPAVKVGFAWWHDPFAAALVGYVVSAIVLYGSGGLRAPSGTFRSTPRGVLCFMAVGLCNGGGVLAMYLALAGGDVALVAPLVACYPIFTIALSALILGRVGLSRRLVAGTAVTVAGVVLLLTL